MYRMRYIFIYYNIIYLILLVLIFIYIKKILNNCYNIEHFDSTNNPQDSTNNKNDSTNNPQDSTNNPEEKDDIDKIFNQIITRKNNMKEKILSMIESDEREKYNVDPIDKTSIYDITLYESKYNNATELANNLKNKIT